MLNEAVTQLRHIQNRCAQSPEVEKIIAARDSVRQRYQAMFSPDRIPQLVESDFREFLLFKNNMHWTGLHRQGPRICHDMDGLRQGLLALHDHSQPIEARWDSASGSTKYLGHATLSAVLHILYPHECGVWNETSESGLRGLGLWPEFVRGASKGQRYKKINDCLCALAKSLNVDLWDLDAFMWGLKEYGLSILEDKISREPDLSLSKKEFLREALRRDSREVAWIKKRYGHRCQICASVPFGGDLGSDLSEAHHIDWLSCGGADSRDNMILLCPNHHAAIHMADPPPEFDRESLCFRFSGNLAVKVQIDLHLKAPGDRAVA